MHSRHGKTCSGARGVVPVVFRIADMFCNRRFADCFHDYRVVVGALAELDVYLALAQYAAQV
jgi:hypothetical protein